jgi:hypothetical protein
MNQCLWVPNRVLEGWSGDKYHSQFLWDCYFEDKSLPIESNIWKSSVDEFVFVKQKQNFSTKGGKKSHKW